MSLNSFDGVFSFIPTALNQLTLAKGDDSPDILQLSKDRAPGLLPQTRPMSLSPLGCLSPQLDPTHDLNPKPQPVIIPHLHYNKERVVRLLQEVSRHIRFLKKSVQLALAHSICEVCDRWMEDHPAEVRPISSRPSKPLQGSASSAWLMTLHRQSSCRDS